LGETVKGLRWWDFPDSELLKQ